MSSLCRSLALIGLTGVLTPAAAEPPAGYRQQWAAAAAGIDADIERHRKRDLEIVLADAAGRPAADATIEVRHLRHDFLFGCNLFVLGQLATPELNARYESRFAGLFNSATAAFYWRELEPRDGQTRFGKDSAPIWRRPPPDAVVEWCAARGITVKGHALMYVKTKFMPDWIDPADRVALERLGERHMAEIAARYAASIPIWDAVNEEIPRLAQPQQWYAVPDDFLAWCFQTAGRLFPATTRLLINDGTLQAHVTTDQYEAMIRQLLARKLRVEGIGLQYHTSRKSQYTASHATPAHLAAVYRQLGRLGLPLYITEITIPGAGAGGPAEQAEIAANLYRLWFSSPSMAGVTWWNLGDGTAYEQENAALGGLLDAEMNPKPAYARLDDLINRQWRTHATLASDAAGKASLRGFCGRYAVEVRRGGKSQRFEIHLPEGPRLHHVRLTLR